MSQHEFNQHVREFNAHREQLRREITQASEAPLIVCINDPDQVIDLDPHRTVTYLENGVPYCYLGHADCYDGHEAARLADETDYEDDRSQ